MNKRTKALQFSKETKERLLRRDGGCIFCKKRYNMEKATQMACSILDPMHIVNKSQGGLGIEENGVVGCRYHHKEMDNGNMGLRDEMQQIIEEYMKDIYPGWNKSDLVYKK